MRSSIRVMSTSACFMCTQVCRRSLIARIHLPVSTDRSPISSNTGSGSSVTSGPSVLGERAAGEARAGR